MYSLILCFIVFVLLVSVSVVMITTIAKLTLKTIKCGAEDEKIKKEYFKTLSKSKKGKGIDCMLSLLLCLILCAVFAFSLFVGFREKSYSDTMPTIKVVQSDSMKTKHEKNTYLDENDLNNQFSRFDIVLTYKVPDQFDLELYDIVVYEVNGMDVIHRIVQIEEPNQYHPNERWFRLQGDANESPDRFPVKYEQIKGIYRDQKVPFVGSFILFMQSPAGWICILLVVVAFIATPLLERKIKKATNLRLIEIGVIIPGVEPVVELTEDDEDYVRPDFLDDREPELSLLAVENDSETEVAVSEDDLAVEEPIVDPWLNLNTFAEKLDASSEFVKETVADIQELLLNIDGSFKTESKQYRTFRTQKVALARFEFLGRTLYAYLGANPDDYVQSGYIYTDVSDVKQFKNYPMRVILTSERQRDLVKALLCDIVKNNGLTIGDVQRFEYPTDRTLFADALSDLPGNAIKYYSIVRSEAESLGGAYMVDGYDREFRTDDTPIACMEIRGKSVCLYINADPAEHGDGLTLTDVPRYRVEEYPLGIVLSSDEDLKLSVRIIKDLAKKHGLTDTRGEKL